MNNDKSAIQVIAGAARCPEYSPSMVKALMKKLDTMEKNRPRSSETRIKFLLCINDI